MKTKILFFSLCMATFAMAQTLENDPQSSDSTSNRDITEWDFDGTDVFIGSNVVRVGIRTDSPDEALHVNGGVKIGYSTSATARAANVLTFGSGNNVKIGEFDADNALSFYATKFCFNTGNVGIKSTYASYPLDVNGKVFLRTVNQDPVTGWNTSYLYWNAHNLIMGTPPGHAAHNSLDLKPGGSTDPQPLFSRLRPGSMALTRITARQR